MMSAVEETLDAVVQKQSYVEEFYNTVTELLEHCKHLHSSFASISGMFCSDGLYNGALNDMVALNRSDRAILTRKQDAGEIPQFQVVSPFSTYKSIFGD